jgi:hypothetical protein
LEQDIAHRPAPRSEPVGQFYLAKALFRFQLAGKDFIPQPLGDLFTDGTDRASLMGVVHAGNKPANPGLSTIRNLT